MKENIILDKSFSFAVRIVKLSQFLTTEKREFSISQQILKSGTSIGANIEEAIGGQSTKDFISKFSIAYKEARETHYWLRLLHETGFIDSKLFNSIFDDCVEIIKLLTSILKTTKNNY